MAAVIFGLARIAIVNSERREAEKKRGDALQQSVDALRARTDQNREFFEIVRQLLVAQGDAQKQALLDQLRGFQFTEPTTTTTSTTVRQGARSTPTTTTPPNSSPTTAPRAPPSTTTTTVPPSQPPPPAPPPSRPCVTVLGLGVCTPAPPTAATNERNHP